MKDINPELTVQHAARVKQFLADDVIQEVLAAMSLMYYKEFLDSKSSEERIRAQAKGVVVRDFETTLRAVVGAGEHVSEMTKAHEKRITQNAPRT